jgi:hypothetical protein
MARKPENQFIASVQMDMWVEFKFIDKIPKTETFRLDLTPRQLEWLRDRHQEGREVYVILGTKDGGVIFSDREWEGIFSQKELLSRVISRKDIAEWIATATHGTYVPPQRGKMRRIADEPVIMKRKRK